MSKKGQLGATVIIGISVTLIIAVIMVGIVFSQITNQQTETAVSNDLFTANNDTCVRLDASNCIQPASLTVANGTDDFSGNFSECGDGNDVYGAQLSAVGGGTGLDGTGLNASYTQRDCGYITGTTGTILNYVPILLAVALLAFLGFYIGRK